MLNVTEARITLCDDARLYFRLFRVYIYLEYPLICLKLLPFYGELALAGLCSLVFA